MYFAWGETDGYKNATDKPGGFTWSSLKYCSDDSGEIFSKYVNTPWNSWNGVADNKTILEPEDDAAHIHMGGKWRMPTSKEFSELTQNCDWSYTTKNGVYGALFTSKTDKSKQLFLPGYGYALDNKLNGSDIQYWSSSLGDYDSGIKLVDDSGEWMIDSESKKQGLQIRGVISK